MKLEKPGSKVKNRQKTKHFYTHDIQIPESKHCRMCWNETGTEAYRHSESTRIKMLSGGGIMGGKITDKLSAWLCNNCDQIASRKPDKDLEFKTHMEHDLMWFDLIARTWLI